MARSDPNLPADTRSIRRGERAYPRLLGEIDDPPAFLFARGSLSRAPAVAVVGSRDCTAYGRRIAYRLSADIARCGLVVVSGLARGIDAAAHRGALDAGGETVAVLPTGIDRIYPPSHDKLAGRIARSGALVTEFEPGTRVYPANFHQRNRIIAGLAVATVVVEAAHKSGTKITVKYALEYDREVLAVPGPIDSRTSEGANALIAEGAAPCTGIDSLLRQLPAWAQRDVGPRRAAVARQAEALLSGLPASARAVLGAIPADRSCGVEHLASVTGLPVAQILAALTDIETRGLIRSVGGQRYERV